MLLEEMASIFITPYLLIFVLPKVCFEQDQRKFVSRLCCIMIYLFPHLQRVNDILCFISEFTVYVDGVGDVCRFVSVLCYYLLRSTNVATLHGS